jgi:hypothetical protein
LETTSPVNPPLPWRIIGSGIEARWNVESDESHPTLTNFWTGRGGILINGVLLSHNQRLEA